MITVKVYTILREKLGTDTITLEAKNITEVLEQLLKKFGENLKEILYEKSGRIKGYFIFLLNGRVIGANKFTQTKLNPGDVLHIFPPIAGG